MKKYTILKIEVVEMQYIDVICTSGPLKDGEFDNSDIWWNN